MKQKILWIAAAIIIAAAGAAYYQYGNRERQFLDQAFVQLRGGGGSEPVAEIKLESGESAAVILEHDCCSGAGFDAVAIRTSDGAEFYAKKNYCGLEGFYPTVKDDAARDLNDSRVSSMPRGTTRKKANKPRHATTRSRIVEMIFRNYSPKPVSDFRRGY